MLACRRPPSKCEAAQTSFGSSGTKENCTTRSPSILQSALPHCKSTPQARPLPRHHRGHHSISITISISISEFVPVTIVSITHSTSHPSSSSPSYQHHHQHEHQVVFSITSRNRSRLRLLRASVNLSRLMLLLPPVILGSCSSFMRRLTGANDSMACYDDFLTTN